MTATPNPAPEPDGSPAAPVAPPDRERGGAPRPIGIEDWGAYLDRFRPEMRDAWRRAQATTAPGPVETDEDRARDARAEVEATRARNRVNAWRARLEHSWADFTGAALGDLDDVQDPGGRVSGWLDGPSRTLMLVGGYGTGKTHAALAVGNAAVGRPRPLWAVAWTVPDLNDALRPGGDPTALDHALACDLLLMDDLGAERITEWTIEQLYRIVDHRVRNCLKTVVPTNLPYDDRGFDDTPETARPVHPNLVERYGPRLVDRLIHDATIVRYRGTSRRRPIPF
jgi:DNA replication protein DnaC